MADQKTTKTLIVLGCARGGTSLIAGMLRELGVVMGERLRGTNHEDIEFLNPEPEELKKVVQRRNHAYRLWGFKNPQAIHFLPAIWDQLINPHVIYVFRNRVHIAQSFLKYESGRTLEEAIADVVHRYHLIESFLSLHASPVLEINYDSTVKDPVTFVDEACRFADLQPAQAQRRHALAFADSSRGYKLTSLDQPLEVSIEQQAEVPSLPPVEDLVVFHRNLQAERGQCIPTNDDPQIILERSKSYLTFERSVEVSFSFHCDDPHTQAFMYFDSGYGFSHLNQEPVALTNGTNHLRIVSDRKCYALRIDPVQKAVPFELSDLQVSS